MKPPTSPNGTEPFDGVPVALSSASGNVAQPVAGEVNGAAAAAFERQLAVARGRQHLRGRRGERERVARRRVDLPVGGGARSRRRAPRPRRRWRGTAWRACRACSSRAASPASGPCRRRPRGAVGRRPQCVAAALERIACRGGGGGRRRGPERASAHVIPNRLAMRTRSPHGHPTPEARESTRVDRRARRF